MVCHGHPCHTWLGWCKGYMTKPKPRYVSLDVRRVIDRILPLMPPFIVDIRYSNDFPMIFWPLKPPPAAARRSPATAAPRAHCRPLRCHGSPGRGPKGLEISGTNPGDGGKNWWKYDGNIWKYDGNMMEIWWKNDGNMMEIWWKYDGNMMEIWWKYDGNMVEIWWKYGKWWILWWRWWKYDGYMWWKYDGNMENDEFYDGNDENMMEIWWNYDEIMMEIWWKYGK